MYIGMMMVCITLFAIPIPSACGQNLRKTSCIELFCNSAAVLTQNRPKCKVTTQDHFRFCTCDISNGSTSSKCFSPGGGLRFDVDMQTNDSELLVTIRNSECSTKFRIFCEMLFNYLTLTNASDFTLVCYRREATLPSNSCNQQPSVENLKETANLKLSISGKTSIVRRLVDCVERLRGKGSVVFPEIPDLNLTYNLIVEVPASSFNNVEELKMCNVQVDVTCQNCCLNAQVAGQVAKQWASSSVNFRNNPIRDIDLQFLISLSHLRTVYLSGVNHVDISGLQLMSPFYINRNSTNLATQVFISGFVFDTCEFLSFLRVNKRIAKPENVSMAKSMVFIFQNITVGNQVYFNMTDVEQNLRNEECEYKFYCPHNCFCHTKGFEETIIVNCTGKNLTSFPNVDQFKSPIELHLNNNNISSTESTTFHSWSIIKKLYLYNNQLKSLENFEVSEVLQVLDLRHNQFQSFLSSLGRKDWRMFLQHSVNLSLSSNPWTCDCYTPEMRYVFQRINIVDFNDVSCTEGFSGKLNYLVNASDIELCPLTSSSKSLFEMSQDITNNSLQFQSEIAPESSNQPMLTILLPTIALSVIVISAAGVVTYRYKELIKLWLFTHGYCLRFVTEDDVDTNKVFDAFVSYSSLDEEWVANHLVKGLEQGNPPYKLCLHNRDWLGGEWIIDQILKSVRHSRRTIIVLTDNFVESDWSRMEFAAAYQQSITDHMNRVLIVIPGEIPETSKLGQEMGNFVRLNTYLKWNDPYFWPKLKSAMPRNRPRSQQEKHDYDIVTNR